jgi:peptidoglycan/LPS O-acetylase OafA/YrhL
LRWSWRVYLVSRFARLQLVLVPALALGAVWDWIGLRTPQAFSLYYNALYKFNATSVASRFTISAFFGNFFYLQSFISPVFGSNGPLWSLSYEFWYYIIFPAMILAIAAWGGIRMRFFYAGMLLLLLWFVGWQISFYFPIWLLGAFEGYLLRKSKFRPAFPGISVLGGLVFAGALAWCRTHRLSSDVLTDYVVAVCFGVWLYTLLLGSREDVQPAYERMAKKISGFSYTLYLTHFPVLLLLRGLLNPKGGWQPDLLHLSCALSIGLGMVIYAYCVAELTEAHTPEVRRSLLNATAPKGELARS